MQVLQLRVRTTYVLNLKVPVLYPESNYGIRYVIARRIGKTKENSPGC